jgi:rRNA-processing protein EBP2
MSGRLTPEECTQILQQKLADLKEDLGDELLNFKASFVLSLPRSPVVSNVNNDFEREQAFQEVTLEGVRVARELLIQANIPYIRPPTMFAEMVKTDEQMDRIRESLSEQAQRKEQAIAKSQQKKDMKKPPPPKAKPRPGVSMKPIRDSKQHKRARSRSTE